MLRQWHSSQERKLVPLLRFYLVTSSIKYSSQGHKCSDPGTCCSVSKLFTVLVIAFWFRLTYLLSYSSMHSNHALEPSKTLSSISPFVLHSRARILAIIGMVYLSISPRSAHHSIEWWLLRDSGIPTNRVISPSHASKNQRNLFTTCFCHLLAQPIDIRHQLGLFSLVVMTWGACMPWDENRDISLRWHAG